MAKRPVKKKKQADYQQLAKPFVVISGIVGSIVIISAQRRP
jgi:hypothetical protein